MIDKLASLKTLAAGTIACRVGDRDNKTLSDRLAVGTYKHGSRGKYRREKGLALYGNLICLRKLHYGRRKKRR